MAVHLGPPGSDAAPVVNPVEIGLGVVVPIPVLVVQGLTTGQPAPVTQVQRVQPVRLRAQRRPVRRQRRTPVGAVPRRPAHGAQATTANVVPAEIANAVDFTVKVIDVAVFDLNVTVPCPINAPAETEYE